MPDLERGYWSEEKSSIAAIRLCRFLVLCSDGTIHLEVDNLNPTFRALQEGEIIDVGDALCAVEHHAAPRWDGQPCHGSPHIVQPATFPNAGAGIECGGWMVFTTDSEQAAETEVRGQRWSLMTPDGQVIESESDPKMLLMAMHQWLAVESVEAILTTAADLGAHPDDSAH